MRKVSRRELLQGAGFAGTCFASQGHHPQSGSAKLVVPPLLDIERLAKFVDPLPIPPVARPLGLRVDPESLRHKLPYYRVPMQAVTCKVHRDLPATRFWGFDGSVPGKTIEVRRGEPVLIEWPNELPNRHMFSVDHSIMGAERDKPEVRTVVHLHGAKAPPISDGYPENWYTPGKSVVYRYPNEQDAALLWYHDHAMGINRLNMMAGLFGLYVIRDPEEDSLHLPSGTYEVPLVLFDRMLTPDGQLYYPVSDTPDAPWVPEFFGNAVLVNGKLLPFLEVEPRPYRLRIANVSNSRLYNLSLANRAEFLQIATDQGLIAVPNRAKILFLAPAERADIVIDFAEHKGNRLVLQNGVVEVMEFRVTKPLLGTPTPIPNRLRDVPSIPESEAVRTRYLTLEENDDLMERPVIHLLNGSRWHDAVTENPKLGSIEIWAFVNLTEDLHPIHLHLVNFRILDRRSFDDVEYLAHKRIRYTDEPVKASPAEAGWKDTVQAHPKMVTRIIIHFQGYAGRYVWHCHILEHEDNEMMRPFDVLPAGTESD